MHLDFFNFNKDPFSAAPDPEFLFLGASHMETLKTISRAAANRRGFIVISGEAGVGKTAILRAYVEKTDPQTTRVIDLMSAELSFDRLLEQMVSELGIACSEGEPLKPLLLSRLEEECDKDNNVVLIIDEAQNMPVETLDLLRTFADMENSRGKLLQIVLAGQPELDKKLKLPVLKELNKIIAVRCSIQPMSADESLAYIEYRISKASTGHNPVFTKEALNRIVKEAGGIPRMINVICDNALITAFGYQQSPVNEQIAKKAIMLFRGTRPGFFSKWKFVAVASLIVFFLLAVIAFMAWRPSRKIPLTSKRHGALSAAVAAKGNSSVNVKPSNNMKQRFSNREKPSAKHLIALAKTKFRKDPAEAEKLLHKAIESDPKNYEGYFQLGRLLTFKGDYRGAIREYRKALRINNRIADIHFNLGYIYLRLGRYSLARHYYLRCLACSPSYKDQVLANLGVIEWKIGNRSRAKRFFLEAIRFNPGNKVARKYLRRLSMRTRRARH